MKPKNLWCVIVTLVAVVLVCPHAHGLLYDGWIEPLNPSTSDEITLYADGWLNDSCWGFGHYDISQEGGSIQLDIYLFDAWKPDLGCYMVATPYGIGEDIGTLQIGTYTVVITEHHDSLRLPEPDLIEFEFTVEHECFISAMW